MFLLKMRWLIASGLELGSNRNTVEYPARGGTSTQYPWGEELEQDGKYHANTWQGEFPNQNSELDGFLGTAPVKSFEPNGYGLISNDWECMEWCINHRGIPLKISRQMPKLL